VPGNARPLPAQRDPGPMARNGYIREPRRSACRPSRCAWRRVRTTRSRRRPRRDRHRLRRAEAPRRGPLRGRGSIPGADLVHATVDQRWQTIVNEALEPARPLRSAPSGEGADPARWCATQRGRGHPGRGGRAELLRESLCAIFRLQPRDSALRQAGSGGSRWCIWPRSGRAEASTPRCRTNPSRYAWGLTVGKCDRQLR